MRNISALTLQAALIAALSGCVTVETQVRRATRSASMCLATAMPIAEANVCLVKRGFSGIRERKWTPPPSYQETFIKCNLYRPFMQSCGGITVTVKGGLVDSWEVAGEIDAP